MVNLITLLLRRQRMRWWMLLAFLLILQSETGTADAVPVFLIGKFLLHLYGSSHDCSDCFFHGFAPISVPILFFVLPALCGVFSQDIPHLYHIISVNDQFSHFSAPILDFGIKLLLLLYAGFKILHSFFSDAYIERKRVTTGFYGRRTETNTFR